MFGNVPSKLMSDSEYSVIKSDVIKSLDCTYNANNTTGSLFLLKKLSNVVKPSNMQTLLECQLIK